MAMEADYGWVALHRKIRNNAFLMNDDNAFLVFIKLLTYVNSNGQWSGGRNQLGVLVNKNPRTLYDVLQRLQANNIIHISANKAYSTITICNWERYQPSANKSKRFIPTTAQPQPNHSPTTSQHSNNKYKENKNKKRAYALPSKIDDDLAAKEKAAREPRSNAGTKSLKQMFLDHKAMRAKETA